MTGQRPVVQSLVDVAPVPAVVVDSDGVVTQWNGAAEKLFGWSRADVVGDQSPIVPEDAEGDVHERVLRDGDVVDADAERVTRDGRTVSVEITAGPVRGEDGDVVGRVSYFRRHHDGSQPDLSDSSGLAHALQAFPDYVFLYDEDGTYLDVATGWDRQYTLYEEAELVGETVHEFFDDDTADEIVAAIRRAIEAEELQELEYAVETPGGTFWYEGQIAPLPEPPAGVDGSAPHSAGSRGAAVLCARDVTQRREYREQLEAKNEQLEQFASVVSHDLRNPLSVLKGQVEVAREQSAEETPHLDLAIEATERMETLVDDVLTLARQGQRIDEPRPADLSVLVEDAWRLYSDEGTLVVAAEASLGTVETDPARLKEMLSNLFRNSVEHGGDGVTVRVGRLANGFYVEDDGPGIPVERRERVFDSGFTTSDDGTGFGLTIVEEIAAAHGWTVEATTGSDGGARFEFTGVDFV